MSNKAQSEYVVPELSQSAVECRYVFVFYIIPISSDYKPFPILVVPSETGKADSSIIN